MNPYDALIIVAELALGIAGFSGVVVALGARPGIWPRVDRLRLAALLSFSLGALLIVLIALTLLALNFGDQTVWRLSSLFMTILFAAILLSIVPGAWSITRHTTGLKSSYSMAVFIPSVLATAVSVVVQIMNVFGLFTEQAFGAMFSGLAVALTISGVNFVRLLFVARGASDD